MAPCAIKMQERREGEVGEELGRWRLEVWWKAEDALN